MKTSTKILLALSISTLAVGGYVVYTKRRGISAIAKRAINFAKKEYELWNKNGKLKEDDPTIFERVKAYWQEGAEVFWDKAKMINEAWSAAFISYIMKKSGAGNDFKYSTSHSVYIKDAVKNRKENNKNPFKAYKPEEVSLAKGDIVCYPRQSGVSYDSTGAYASHCDIVIDVKKDHAVTVGGNVSNSVSETKVSIDKNKKITDKKYFVVIKNKKS